LRGRETELLGQVVQSLTDRDRWFRGMSAIIYELDDLSVHNDYEFGTDEESRESLRNGLMEDWDIHDRATLMLGLERIKSGQRSYLYGEMKAFLDPLRDEEQWAFIQSLNPKNTNYHEYLIVRTYMYKLPSEGIAAWDWGCYADLCRKCAHVGIITETESDELVLKIALKAQSAYNSWKEYTVAFIAGKLLWMGKSQEETVQRHLNVVRRLIIDYSSIYNKVDWNLDLL